MTKNISILGVTGSIGSSALKVVDHFPGIRIIAVSIHKNVEALLKILDSYAIEKAVIVDEKAYLAYFDPHHSVYKGTKIMTGQAAMAEICSDQRNNIILNAISGKYGLDPSCRILESGINMALANKESIVCAGCYLKKLAGRNQSRIVPVDSEHSAIFSLLKNRSPHLIDKIYLTASGGPFLNLDKKDWHTIDVKAALNHPTWKMGHKISIDSATMANKGLEVIEAHYLFDIEYERINVLIHPQSMIHSLIETIDGEIYAQLGPKDMALPIQNALFFPDLLKNNYQRFDFSQKIQLELMPMDFKKFRMLHYAYICGQADGVYPAFYNFVNEKLVGLFLNQKINFLDIEEIMAQAIDHFDADNSIDQYDLEIDSIYQIDTYAQNLIQKILNQK